MPLTDWLATMTAMSPPRPPPPGSSPKAQRLARQFARPLERFLRIEASSGILLFAMAVIALGWANSPWASTYESLLHTPISLGFGEHAFSRTLHFWINEILMVVFFFVVGLEIRRELHEGELSDAKRAALPVAVAIGGMLAPALIYIAINYGSAASSGWGVPIATDIAFAVGVLALLGKRVPSALRVLLLSAAIIDDVGAILIIALFYSSGIAVLGLAVAAGGIALVIALQRLGQRSVVPYVAAGAIVWAGLLYAGVHPTLAGVILGLLTPARSWFGHAEFLQESEAALTEFRKKADAGPSAHSLLPELNRLNMARIEAVPPVTRIEAALHPWVAYGIMPLFALANAGVALGDVSFGGEAATGIALGVGLGLVVGKPLGVIVFSWLMVRLGVAALPRGVSWSGVLVVGCVAGIGFTMALFIGALSFADPAMLGVAKVSVLAASAAAGLLGIVIGLKTLPRQQSADVAAITADDAEKSTNY